MRSLSKYQPLEPVDLPVSNRSEQMKALKAELATLNARRRAVSQAQDSIRELIRFAKEGNELSICALVDIAVRAICALNRDVLKEHPEIVRRASRTGVTWPGMISRKRSLVEANKRLMDNLQLGGGSIFSQKKWQPNAPSTQAALGLFLPYLYRVDWSARPPLTKKEKRELFDAAWEGILASGIQPEHVEKLAALGRSRQTKVPKYCKNLHSATRNANVRDEIKRQLWKAFDNLLADAGT